MRMFTLTRTTKAIMLNDEIVSAPFTQVLPVYTDKPGEEALDELVRNRVINSNTTWLASDDWNAKPDNFFPKGAGEYKYKFVASPQTEKRIMVLVNTGFNDYYNDEYTRNGACEFFAGPYANEELAKEEARNLMCNFIYDEWAEENDIPLGSEYEYNCEGHYTSAKVVVIDVIQ